MKLSLILTTILFFFITTLVNGQDPNTPIEVHDYSMLKFHQKGVKLKNAEVAQILTSYSPAHDEWLEAKGYGGVGIGFKVVGAGLLVRTVIKKYVIKEPFDFYNPPSKNDIANEEDIDRAIFIAGISCLVISLPFSAVKNTKRRKAVEMYNDRIANKNNQSLNLKLNISPSGMGLALSF